MKEQDLVNTILDWLRSHGCWAIRVNSGSMPIEQANGSRRIFRGAPAGTPDILCCVNGKMVGIEAKIGRNKPTMLQLICHEEIKQANGIIVIAYSLDDVIEKLGDMV